MTEPLRGHILVVDDEPDVLELTALTLRARGHTVSTAATADEAVEAARTADFDLVLTDLHLGGADGLDVCARMLAMRPTMPIIVITGDVTLAAAVAAMRAGAFDYLTKPVDGDMLALTAERALKHHRLESEVAVLREEASSARGLEEILGRSPGIQHVRDVIARIASTTASVLITGESGTGKELVARAVHLRSQRAKGPFVALNCAALPHELLESELFGHARGAFTDAKNARKGLFLEANGGTLFLDEIGEMPLTTQVKLLRALQERVVRPVGGSAEVAFDARLIAATNRDLAADVGAKRFREDLYYRINVVTIHVPPLRQRRDDIRTLAEAFLERFAANQNKSVLSISPAAMERLTARDWPGNVRELENAMERAVSMARTDGLGMDAFATDVAPLVEPMPSVMPQTIDGLVTADVQEQMYIQHVLTMLGGNKSRAAEVLGYDRRTLHRKLKRAGEDGQPLKVSSGPRSSPPGNVVPEQLARILVIDGDLDSRDLLQIVLEASGYEVVSASTIAGALALGPADVVLTEITLEDGAGSDLVRKLSPTPVIALSSLRPTTPFRAWVAKPAAATEVLAAIRSALEAPSPNGPAAF